MAQVQKIIGVAQVVNKLHKFTAGFNLKMERAFKKGGLFLQRQSQKCVPVDTANLKNSAYTRAHGNGMKTFVEVGYTARYGIYVHEDLHAKHRWPTSAKFLEGPARVWQPEIIQVILEELKK
jgi:hypothetical protein